MSATDQMIADLRRMVGEPDSTGGYSDAVLKRYIEEFPLIDEWGSVPYTKDTSTTPPSKKVNTSWVATYDLNAAAAKVWGEKAAPRTSQYSFSADGAQYQRSDTYRFCMQQARYYGARRAPKSIRAIAWPVENTAALEDLTN